ncbi:hypothetical protein ABPG72_006569 [Tetrahymena utriculariae]
MQQISSNFQELIQNQAFDCQIHKKKCLYLYLEVSDKQASPFRCLKCVTNSLLDSSKFLAIEDLFQCGDDEVLDNWPLLGKDNEGFKKSEKIDLNETFTFFKGFKSSIIDKLEKMEEKLKDQYQIIENNKKLLKDYYNKVSIKKKIQTALYQLPTNPEQYKRQINLYIEEVQANRYDIKSKLDYIYKTLSYYQDYLSTYSLKQFKVPIDNTLDAMQKVINYEIFDVLESKENNDVVAKEQKESFKNNVFYNTIEVPYSPMHVLYSQQYNFKTDFNSLHQKNNSQSFSIIQKFFKY